MWRLRSRQMHECTGTRLLSQQRDLEVGRRAAEEVQEAVAARWQASWLKLLVSEGKGDQIMREASLELEASRLQFKRLTL